MTWRFFFFFFLGSVNDLEVGIIKWKLERLNRPIKLNVSSYVLSLLKLIYQISDSIKFRVFLNTSQLSDNNTYLIRSYYIGLF